MSVQLGAGRGGYGGRGRGGGAGRFKARGKAAPKSFKSGVAEIEGATFNTGHSKYAAQFGRSREDVANYFQMMIQLPRTR